MFREPPHKEEIDLNPLMAHETVNTWFETKIKLTNKLIDNNKKSYANVKAFI